MEPPSTLDRVRALFRKTSEDAQDYEPLVAESNDGSVDDETHVTEDPSHHEQAFSWFEYSIFMLLGCAMLWAWYAIQLAWSYRTANIIAGICS